MQMGKIQTRLNSCLDSLRQNLDLKKLLSGVAVLLAVLIPGALYLGYRSSRSASELPTAGWGLSFRQENQPPVADTTAEALDAYDAKYIGDPQSNSVYLTFEIGRASCRERV